MSLIGVVIILIVVGILLGLMKQIPFLDGTFKQIIFAVVVLAVVLWLLSVFGLLSAVNAVKVPRVGTARVAPPRGAVYQWWNDPWS